MRERLARHPAAAAALLYLVVALAMTWPLAGGLSRDLPADLGDPVLNCALLERNALRLLAALAGDLGALRGFWDARIFHPEPNTLAFSEHLFAQTLLALPVYALTGNVLLSYNLLFLASFVLSALGAFLLAKDVLGRAGPALLAGLCFGFAVYRVEQLSHLQVLSSQWMPFALLGLRRHFETRRSVPLLGAAAAVIAQNLSCGYYLLYFAPLVALVVLVEQARRGRLTDAASWGALLGAAAIVALATLPFVWPYLDVRRSGAILRERAEVELFSADVYAYLTAPEDLRLLGERLRAYPAPEGQLFAGFVPSLLAALALLLPLRSAWSAGSRLAKVAFAVVAIQAAVVLVILGGGGGPASTLVPGLSIRSLPRALLLLAVALGALLAASARCRELARRALASTRGLWALLLLLAVSLSFGPTLRSLGQPLMSGPYLLLYEHVPGYDGLRVPARWAMLASLFLALLAGVGAAELQARMRRAGVVLFGCAALFLAEACAAPLLVNDVWSDPGLRRPPPRLARGAEAPAIYRRAAELPRSAVLIEFPFGSDPYELRYMFHQPQHGLPLVNGFSGARPRGYSQARGPLRNLLAEPERARRALAATTATHAIVHEAAWGLPAKGPRVTRWLEEQGAQPLAREGGDVLLALRR
jgi:hypothetical protein